MKKVYHYLCLVSIVGALCSDVIKYLYQVWRLFRKKPNTGIPLGGVW
jgi:hypothetical protein